MSGLIEDHILDENSGEFVFDNDSAAIFPYQVTDNSPGGDFVSSIPIVQNPILQNPEFENFPDYTNLESQKSITGDFCNWDLCPPFYLNVKSWRIQANGSLGDETFAINQVVNTGWTYRQIEVIDEYPFDDEDNGGSETETTSEHEPGLGFIDGRGASFGFSLIYRYTRYFPGEQPDTEGEDEDPPDPDKLTATKSFTVNLGSGQIVWDDNNGEYIFIPVLSGSGLIFIPSADPEGENQSASRDFDLTRKYTVSGNSYITDHVEYDRCKALGLVMTSPEQDDLNLQVTITPEELYTADDEWVQ